MFESNILKTILQMGEFAEGKQFPKVQSQTSSSILHLTTILEYLKRFKNKAYRMLETDDSLNRQYDEIISVLSWSVKDVPFKRDEYLIHLVFLYIDGISRKDALISETNIQQIRDQIAILIRDTELFLNAIYFLYRYPDWRINHQFLMEYVQTRLGHCYFFD